jgi:hypothetical protein
MAFQFTTSYLEDAESLFRYYKRLAEGAMAQISDEQLYVALDEDSNSIAVIVKHMAGNMISRWSDFLHSDGEKPDRNRDEEFTASPESREELLVLWESGWNMLFAALAPLTLADLGRTVTIRSEPHSVMQTINRQLAHYPYHCGQIIFIAKHLNGTKWQTLSVARGKSQEYTKRVAAGESSQR